MKQKVLLIGIDGLMIHRAIDSGRAKTLKALRDQSFFIDTQVDMPTVSGPSWSTLLTGKQQDVHQVVDNYFQNHNLQEAPDFLTQALAKNSNLKTYAAAGWPPLIDPNDVGPVIANVGHERFHQDGEKLGYLTVDKEVFSNALETLEKLEPDLGFIYFCEADEAGHKHGTLTGPYFDAIERIDRYVEAIYQALIKRNEKWLLVIVTDHGHRDEGGHGGDSPQERASFILAHGINREHPNWSEDLKPHQLAEHLLEHL